MAGTRQEMMSNSPWTRSSKVKWMLIETGNFDVEFTSFQNWCFEACKICKLKQTDTAPYRNNKQR